MGNVIINVVFKIIGVIANIVTLPLQGLSVVFPATSVITDIFSSIAFVLTKALQGLLFWLDVLLVPKWIFVAFISFGLGIFAFNLTIRVVGLILATYHYFKP